MSKQISLLTTPSGSLEFVGWAIPVELVYTEDPQVVEDQMRLPASYRTLTKRRYASAADAVQAATNLGYTVHDHASPQQRK